ncbi:MAG: hypothetical protein ACO3YM_01235 [Candidatus Kapaibacteriota bacterium]
MKVITTLFWGFCSLYASGFAQHQYWDISYGKDVIGPESAPLTMAIFNDALHIGGQFRRLNSNTQNILQTGYVASWKNGIWNGLNGGMNAPLTALCVGPNNVLYASGSFTRCNDGQLQGIASWNGSNWTALKGLSTGNINVLMSYENALYAAGIFDTIGNRAAASIARLVQGEWIPLGIGLKNIDASKKSALPHVNALAAFNGKLFVGGDFDSAGNIKARNIAYWDGKEWHGMGEGIQGEVDAITVLSNGNVIVASTIKMGTAIFPSPLMSWNGSSWTILGLPPGCIAINTLANDGMRVFVGGDFIMDSTKNDYGLAMLDERGFTSLGGGVRGIITTLLYKHGILYCAGNFMRVSDTISCRNIADYVLQKQDTKKDDNELSISIYPNPNQQDYVSISFMLEQAGEVEICLTMTDGRILECFGQGHYEKGLHQITKSLHNGIPSGHYQCMLQHNGNIRTVPMNIIH